MGSQLGGQFWNLMPGDSVGKSVMGVEEGFGDVARDDF